MKRGFIKSCRGSLHQSPPIHQSKQLSSGHIPVRRQQHGFWVSGIMGFSMDFQLYLLTFFSVLSIYYFWIGKTNQQEVIVSNSHFFIDFRGREEGGRGRHQCIVLLIYEFIDWFLYVPWQRIKPATLAYWNDALTNWAIWPGPLNCFKSLNHCSQIYIIGNVFIWENCKLKTEWMLPITRQQGSWSPKK